MNRGWQRALKIAGIYALCGLLWIALSDRVLASLIQDSSMLTKFQTFKGWAFILITAALVFLLSRKALLETERLSLKMRESESRFRAIFENVNVTTLVVDPADGRILDANETAAAFYGWSRELLRSMNISRINTLTPEEIRVRMDEAKSRKKGFFLFSHRRADGSVRDVEVYSGPIPFEGKTALCSIIHDVTERKLAEEALRESERRFRGAFENAAVGAAMVDLTGRFIKVNRFLCAMLGYSEEELLSKTFSDITHPDDVWIGLDYLKRLVAGEMEFASFEKRYIRNDGSVLYCIVSPGVVCDDRGEPQYFISLFQDITERKQDEEKISKYSRDLQRLLTVSREMTATTDVAGLYRAAVQTAVDLLRFDFSTVMVLSDDGAGLTIMDSIGFPQTMIGRYGLVEGQGLSTYVVRNKRPDAVLDFRTETRFEVPAVVRDLNIRSALCVPMMLGEEVFGVLIGHTLEQRAFSREDIAIFENIGNEAAIAIKNALSLNELRKSAEKLRNITSNLAEGLYVLNAEGRITFMNEEAQRLLGWSVEDLNERGAHQLIHFRKADGTPLPLDACRMHGITAKRTRYASNDEVFVRKDGTVFPISVVCSPIIEDNGAVTSIVAFRDITETKRLEQEMLKAQKLESIGTLAGGIAHDFNNLLQGVFGYISMAKLTFDRREKALAMLEQAERALHQSVSLTSQLLTFSKGGKPVKKVIGLRPVVENAARFALSGSRVDHRLAIDEGLWPVTADEGQIGQVIQNIVLNAEQAMPLGGTVTITARNVTVPGAGTPRTLAPGDYVVASVQDTGIGIPPQYLEQIFDPYFTTKEKGSGLGLATSYSIVKNHDGAIDVRSEAGKGTTFCIYLPAAGAAVQNRATAAPPPGRKTGKVLVMDDEEFVRKVAGELLSVLGHEVAIAAHGEAAVEAYRRAREAGHPFDIVILDLTIRGGMGGMDTLKALQAIDPEVNAVVSSGYSEDISVSDYRKHGFRAFLKKPYDIENLQEVLNRLME